jgi:class 3 adenylate cyclase
MNDRVRHLATLFADVAGSTGLYQRHGDAATLTAINRVLDAMREVASEFDGRVVKIIGDELMAVFPRAEDAFRAACEMQWRVSEAAPLGDEQIAVRMGFHFGSAIEQDGDVFGDSVNVAARLVELAKAGQIITSGRAIDLLASPLSTSTRRLNRMTLKGMSLEETIYEALWQDSENVTVLMSGAADEPLNAARMILYYDQHQFAMGLPRPKLSLGRDLSNDVVVGDPKASRMHARIEMRRDKFVLVDQSTNGTYVTIEGDRETALRMEEMILRGRGTISFGHPAAKARGVTASFDCQTALGEMPAPIAQRA